MRKNLLQITFFLGYLAMIFGAVMQALEKNFGVWIYVFGVALLVVWRLGTLPKSGDFRTRRQSVISAFATLLLIASAYFMFFAKNLWVPCLMLAVALDLMLSFRFSNKEKK